MQVLPGILSTADTRTLPGSLQYLAPDLACSVRTPVQVGLKVQLAECSAPSIGHKQVLGKRENRTSMFV